MKSVTEPETRERVDSDVQACRIMSVLLYIVLTVF